MAFPEGVEHGGGRGRGALEGDGAADGARVQIAGAHRHHVQRTDIAEIEQLAFFDPLTGLPNRRLLSDRRQTYRLLPEKDFVGFTPPPKTLPVSPGHYQEWIDACRGGVPAIMPWHGWDWVEGGKEAGEAAWRWRRRGSMSAAGPAGAMAAVTTWAAASTSATSARPRR